MKKGILLPIASLPNGNGIGDFGHSSYRFVDCLKKNKFNLWQILPLNPLGDGNSPYQSCSAFAGEELYISLELLYQWGLLDENPQLEFSKTKIEYDKVRKYKNYYLQIAYNNLIYQEKLKQEFDIFKDNCFWLEKYSVFMAFKMQQDIVWNHWPERMINFPEKPFELSEYASNIDFFSFVQFIFYKQWYLLKDYANQNGIQIMGDIPIYVGYDSVDVWEYKANFDLDLDYKPNEVAGVPPDYFSEKGQLWGNPLYNWEYMRQDKYSFWIKRLSWVNELYDVTRFDHFRGLDSYWAIPYGSKDACTGCWKYPDGSEFLQTMFHNIDNLTLVVEDLGEIRDEVRTLKKQFQLAGMRVIQFEAENILQGNIEQCSILYIGTHDNQTLLGWLNDIEENRKNYFSEILETNSQFLNRKLLQYTYKCNCDYSVICAWDIMEVDDSCRLNCPGEVNNQNWTYRIFSIEQFDEKLKEVLHS